MAAWRQFCPVFFGIILLAAAAAFAASKADAKSDKVGIAQHPSGSELMGEWRLVRTPDPAGGADAISIMHAADTSRSDLDLVGLMIRCGKGSPEAVIVLLRPFPLRAQLNVVVGEAGNETRFEATVALPGTAVLVPADATSLVTVSWRTLNDLFIRVEDGQIKILGVVALAGLHPAFKLLTANCPTQ